MNTQVRKGLTEEQVKLVRENSPIAYKAYLNYYTNYFNVNMLQAMATDSSIDPTEVQSAILQLATLMLTENMRDLYDFFDEKGIEVYTTTEGFVGTRGAYIYDRKADRVTHSSVAGDENELLQIPSEDGNPSRIICEQYAFVKAFEVLEDKVNPISKL